MNPANDTSLSGLPGKPELRKFGFLFSIILVILFGLIIPLIRFGIPEGLPIVTGSSGPMWPWWAAAVISSLAAIFPASLIWLYKPWMKFAGVAQWINTRLILLILFYLVILPIGLLRRILGKDSMQRKMDKNASTYRTILGEADLNDMEKPY
jgi:integral membrane sensor domain MASE1